MNNVENSTVHGKVQKFCHGWAKHIGIGMLGAATLLAPLGVTTAKAGDNAISQVQYLQWLATVSGAGLAKTASAADYVSWAKSLGINPNGGWKTGSGDHVNRDLLALTLVEALNLTPSKNNGDNLRTLQREGIDLSGVKGDLDKSALVDLTDDFSLGARLAALGSKDSFVTPLASHSHDKPDEHKVAMCDKDGDPKDVEAKDVPKKLAEGWTLAPCPPDVLMCDKNGKQQTVKAKDVAKKLSEGWTLGVCPTPVPMCAPDYDCDKNDNPLVPPSEVAKRLAQGWKLGTCPGCVLICHHGKTQSIKQEDLAKHLAHGDTAGPCTITEHSHSHDTISHSHSHDK
jgi:hypothetical protein